MPGLPKLTASPLRIADQGYFWVGVEFEDCDGQRVVDGTQMYVEFQIPEELTQPLPVVLIHGGGGQSLDWISTPDGRPGWRTLLLQRGYSVYLVDRPGHGRSPRSLNEQVANVSGGIVPSFEVLSSLFAGAGNPLHTEWPGSKDEDSESLAQLLASQRQTPFDLEKDHVDMRRNMAALLDRIGPAIVITSSAGGPSGWQAADVRPGKVRAIVALEPIGPGGPFPLPFGISAAPLNFEPSLGSGESLDLSDKVSSVHGSQRLQEHPPRQLPALSKVPIAIVTADQSFSHGAGFDANTVEFLRQAGCTRVEHLQLAELGIHGNGHLMMIERNNEKVLDVVTKWLDEQSIDVEVSSTTSSS